MATPNASRYWLSIQNARKRYEKEGDWDAYIADNAYIAIRMYAQQLEKNPRFRGVSTAVAGSQHLIKGAVQTMAHRFSDQHNDPTTTHEDMFSEILRHAKGEFDRDVQPLRDFLAKHFGIRF